MRYPITEGPDLERLEDDWHRHEHRHEGQADNGTTGPKIRSVNDIPLIRDCAAYEIQFIQKPELPEGAVIALTGDSGSGKSTLSTAWAGRVSASGRQVLVLDRENPISVVSDRLKRLDLTDGPGFRYWGGWLPEEAPHPDSRIIIDWVKSCEFPPLLVIDSKVAFQGGDENDAGETRAFMHRCRKIADLGATVLVLHHDGKAETAKDYRGSSDFKAAIDVGFHVSNSSSDNRLDVLRLRCFKSRFGFTGELVYRYAGGQLLRDDSPSAPAITAVDQLSNLLRSNPGVTASKFETLAGHHGLGRNQARRFLDDGVQAEVIQCVPGSRNSRCYSLKESSTDEE
jgi:hypothetical protein